MLFDLDIHCGSQKFQPQDRRKTGVIGLVGIINPEASGVRVIERKQGQLKGQIKPKVVKFPPGTEYVLIDNEIVYLEYPS